MVTHYDLISCASISHNPSSSPHSCLNVNSIIVMHAAGMFLDLLNISYLNAHVTGVSPSSFWDTSSPIL
jgi:hypothetical protein